MEEEEFDLRLCIHEQRETIAKLNADKDELLIKYEKALMDLSEEKAKLKGLKEFMKMHRTELKLNH